MLRRAVLVGSATECEAAIVAMAAATVARWRWAVRVAHGGWCVLGARVSLIIGGDVDGGADVDDVACVDAVEMRPKTPSKAHKSRPVKSDKK